MTTERTQPHAEARARLEAQRRDQAAIASGEPVRYHILAGKSFAVECEDGSRAIVGAGWLAIREEEYAQITAKNAALEGENKRLVEALRPFARIADAFDDDQSDDDAVTFCDERGFIGEGEYDVRVSDFRRARTAIEGGASG